VYIGDNDVMVSLCVYRRQCRDGFIVCI